MSSLSAMLMLAAGSLCCLDVPFSSVYFSTKLYNVDGVCYVDVFYGFLLVSDSLLLGALLCCVVDIAFHAKMKVIFIANTKRMTPVLPCCVWLIDSGI